MAWATTILVLAQGSWRTFSPKDASFSVSLPGAPVEKKQQLDVEKNKVDVRLFIAEAKGGAYVVSDTDFGSENLGGNAERRLTNARDGAVSSVAGKLLHERKIKLGETPGRELWIETEKAGMIHARLYAAKSRLFQTMAIGSKEFIESKDATKFLDSFKIGK